MKHCFYCEEDHPLTLEYYHRDKRAKNGLTTYCKAERHFRERDARIRRTYGISQKEYDALVAENGGKCKICKEIPRDGLCVDHDHDTGHIRGLLCHECNRGIDSLRDDPVLLCMALEYLGSIQQLQADLKIV